MKYLILFAAMFGAGLYAFGGVDLEALLGLPSAVVDTVIVAIAALFTLAFVVRMVWTAVYIFSGQYALDRRLDQWIK
ncbi:MAG: hypothetical protein AB1457_14845 [Chloroflexota bacterium]